jgi:CRISPR-associated helicase Cas3/CRISPR-associated endonuclease Cas3-HD
MEVLMMRHEKEPIHRTYYAKSKLPNGKQPTNKEHLEKVSRLAGQFGAEFGCQQEAALAGQLHDFGKYSERFQKVLEKEEHRIDHAVCGAARLYAEKKQQRAYQPIIEAINGHHDGLVEFGMLKDLLYGILSSETEQTANGGKTAALNGVKQFQTAIQAFQQDFPDYQSPKLSEFLPAGDTDADYMLYTRMLLSCLVDADYSISASDRRENYLEETEQNDFEPEALLQKLYDHRETIRRDSTADSEVNQIRDRLFERCGEVGEHSASGLFTLTAPTGTGKTLALLHFALRHCVRHGKKRIIVVLPFLTLAEQTTKTYRAIFQDVLVDHSQSNLSDDARELAARWSVPVVITTSVKFFESLFACLPTDCRKLHSIANSVVLFDEAQSLPPEVTGCTLQAVRELCDRYHCTMVFSTATQPDFNQIDKLWQPTEIMPDHGWMYQALRRVEVHWNLASPTPLGQIAEEMARETNVCAIVNLRRHARKLYSELKKQCARSDEVFFLTTDLCPAHRSEIVKEIQRRQKEGLPCRVVATQCIEAGVDLDFDVLYRALAPLDAIIQAAGRCNRNGRLIQGGTVTVFVPDEEGTLYPDDQGSHWYHNAAELVKELVHHHPIDIDDPAHIQAYYQLLFQHQKDKPALTKAITSRCFAETDKQYKLIENRGVHIIVPFIGQQELYTQLEEEFKMHGITKGGIKQAVPITVTSFDHNMISYAEQLFLAGHGHGERIPAPYYILRPQHQDLYLPDMGLQFPE